MTYTKITYKPEGASRARSVILRNVTLSDRITTGAEVDGEGDYRGRVHVIENVLVQARKPMVMDLSHGKLVPAIG